MSEVDSVEVDSVEVNPEPGEKVEEAPAAAAAPEEKVDDVLETLRPSADPVKRKVGVGAEETEYIQKPLSFFGKMDLYALVGRTLDAAMQSGMSIDALLDDVVPDVGNRQLTAADFGAADQMMATIAKVTRFAPQLLVDCYTIFLNVPPNDRAWFKETVVKPVDEGGISDEEGIDILNTFIAQNAEAIEAFFVQHLPLVSKTFRASRSGRSD